MPRTHRFHVRAAIDAIYDRVLAPEAWLRSCPRYRGLVSVEDWPEVGSAIVVRCASLGVPIRLRREVVAHERGRRLVLREEALGGLRLDRLGLEFAPGDDGTVNVTLTVEPTARHAWARPLVRLLSLPFGRITPKAMERFTAMATGPA